MALRFTPKPDFAHIRSFHRPYPEFGTPVNEVVTTLLPPSSVVKSDSVFRILDSSAAGHGRANHPPQGRQTMNRRLTTRN